MRIAYACGGFAHISVIAASPRACACGAHPAYPSTPAPPHLTAQQPQPPPGVPLGHGFSRKVEIVGAGLHRQRQPLRLGSSKLREQVRICTCGQAVRGVGRDCRAGQGPLARQLHGQQDEPAESCAPAWLPHQTGARCAAGTRAWWGCPRWRAARPAAPAPRSAQSGGGGRPARWHAGVGRPAERPGAGG